MKPKKGAKKAEATRVKTLAVEMLAWQVVNANTAEEVDALIARHNRQSKRTKKQRNQGEKTRRKK